MTRNITALVGGALAVPAVLYGWLAAASYIYCNGGGFPDLFVFPFDQWLQVAPYWQYNWWITLWIVVSAVAPPGLVGLAVFAWVRRTQGNRLRRPFFGGLMELERGPTRNHGTSRYRTMKEAMELFPGPDREYGGIAVGEAYRVDEDSVAHKRFIPRDKSTWGRGGTAPLLIDPCQDGTGSTHSIVVGGPGSYKSASAVTTILRWTGSSVILDPSKELGPMLHNALIKQGKRVFHIGFNDKKGMLATGMNVLGWIDIEHPEAEMHIKTVVSWIYDEDAAAKGSKNDDPFFMPMGKSLVTCLLAHLMWSKDPAPKTLATLSIALSIPETPMMKMLEGINKTSNSPMAQRLAATLMGCRAPETFSGVYMNASNGTSWLTLSSYMKVVSEGAFDPKYLLDGDTTVFLNIGLQTLENSVSIARSLVGALLNTAYMADGATNGRILYLLDEAARLGKLKVLETARDAGRKYKITIQMLLQSLGQLQDSWGEHGYKSWMDSVSWIAYGAIQAGGASKDLSTQLGTHSVLAYSESDQNNRTTQAGFGSGSRSSGGSTSTHEIKRNLENIADLQQGLRADEIIVVPNSGYPIRCGRAIGFRREEIRRQLGGNRFVRDAA